MASLLSADADEHIAVTEANDGSAHAATARGLWFGLVQLAAQDGPEWILYVAGCPTFDSSDEEAEWATECASFPTGADD